MSGMWWWQVVLAVGLTPEAPARGWGAVVWIGRGGVALVWSFSGCLYLCLSVTSVATVFFWVLLGLLWLLPFLIVVIA